MRPAAYWFLALTIAVVCYEVEARPIKKYPYQSCFVAAANLHGLPLDLLLAVAATESDWDADARSKANAHGIMQIQWPGTARHLGVVRLAELYNPCLNISLGAQYLKELLALFEGSEKRALAAYNYGPTRIRTSTVLPDGAIKYVATVTRHRSKITAGLLPQPLLADSSKNLVAFDSELRAQRLASTLARRLVGATVKVAQQKQGYAVVLEIGAGGLTVSDRLTLNNLGWNL